MTKKLLIIEDDQTFSAGLVRALSRRDYECETAASIVEAKHVLESFRPNHVLLDLNLGSESTQNFIPEIKKMVPQTSLVVLTGFGTIPSAVQAVKDGATSYLTKPATPDSIDRALNESAKQNVPAPLWDLENNHIVKVLTECGGNITQAAKKLGLHRRTLQRRLKKV